MIEEFKKIVDGDKKLVGLLVVLKKENGDFIMRDAVVYDDDVDVDVLYYLLLARCLRYVNVKKERVNWRFWVRYYWRYLLNLIAVH